ncbi:hypothetical protein K443DRAFT_550400 [Laccaria amethystina LaAM-08-1]|uniref:Unplaced genomic scaffold K443scaffold_67, whole genome shotgun sequence n=1 Tax=Laccaria amethystina LaAM-08-1 TaxID=1095629 RepID=A0A0C9XJQ7_9AGAR|nr:hypothetical protein K443DRAFT_550400 [Laccaria amethystina LaAM-08-1]
MLKLSALSVVCICRPPCRWPSYLPFSKLPNRGVPALSRIRPNEYSVSSPPSPLRVLRLTMVVVPITPPLFHPRSGTTQSIHSLTFRRKLSNSVYKKTRALPATRCQGERRVVK